MDYRLLGKTGLRVSALGFGCGAIGGLMVRGEGDEQRRAVARAIETGVNYFDTAATYGNGQSERALGQVLRELRADVFVGTKVRVMVDQSSEAPQAIRRSAEESLRRLGREQVDLLQLHNNVASASGQQGRLDVDTVLGPVAEGLRAVREAGLTRFIGFTGLGEAAALHRVVDAGIFDTVQCYVNALNPTAGWDVPDVPEQSFERLIDRAAAADHGVIAIRVLAAGALADEGQRHPNAGDPGSTLTAGGDYAGHVQRARELRALADDLGLESPAELSFRLVLSHPGVSTALIGFSDTHQLETALRWAGRGPLDEGAVRRTLAAAAASDRAD